MSNLLEIKSDLKFLVIDETPTFREAIGQSLKTLGFKNVLTAADGLGGLALLKSENIGFIICERVLKQVSGMEVLKEIREDPTYERCPFLMMCGDIQKDDVLLAAEFGIDGFLRKPFVIKDITTRITAAMQKFQDPNSLESKFEQGRTAFRRGDYETAAETYQQIRGMNPSSARAHVAYARCMRAKGNLEESELALKEAIDANCMYVHAFHDLGLVYLSMEKPDLALKNFDSAIQLSPGNPIRYEAIADILMKREEWEKAENYLMRAVKLELAYPLLFAQVGKVLFAQKKTDKASKFFEKALIKEPDNISYLNSMGICLKDLGKFEEAVQCYNTALKYRPQDTKILFNKVLCLIGMKDIEKATKVINLILKIDPTYEKAKTKLAELQANSGKQGAA
jgi:tetratricopeptide (TPR) repeat protein